MRQLRQRISSPHADLQRLPPRRDPPQSGFFPGGVFAVIPAAVREAGGERRHERIERVKRRIRVARALRRGIPCRDFRP